MLRVKWIRQRSGALLGIMLFAGLMRNVSTVEAQDKRPSVATPRLYVFDCGRLKSANPQPMLDHGETVTDMSVAAYLIVHPRGTLLWDTGVIPDDLVKPEGATEARATTTTTLRGQLAEIGYKPSEITYLALSHNHYDHSANANEFAASTWLVSRAERDVMFPEQSSEKQTSSALRFAALKDAKTKLIEGQYDVFSDGSVIIIPTPGHTPGHQSLYLRLAKTGSIVLSGDLYHYPVEVTDRDFNYYGGKVSDAEKASRTNLDEFMKERGATLWIGHDLSLFDKLKKSPQYYE